jgi:hypothetical protein
MPINKAAHQKPKYYIAKIGELKEISSHFENELIDRIFEHYEMVKYQEITGTERELREISIRESESILSDDGTLTIRKKIKKNLKYLQIEIGID